MELLFWGLLCLYVRPKPADETDCTLSIHLSNPIILRLSSLLSPQLALTLGLLIHILICAAFIHIKTTSDSLILVLSEKEPKQIS